MMTSRTSHIFAAIIALCATNVLLQPLGAQPCTGKSVPQERTEWYPRAVVKGPDQVSAADRAAMEATLARVESLVRKTGYGTPHGYEAKPAWNYSAPTSRNRLTRYSFGLVIWCPTIAATGGDGEAGIDVIINPDPQSWSEGDRPRRDANGDGLYTLRVRSANQFGSTVAFGDLELDSPTSEGFRVLFTTGDESPTLPVSREEFLRSLIFEVEGKPGAGKKSAYQEWLEKAPERKKNLEETVAAVATSDPAKAQQLRKDLEKAERDNTEMFRQGEEQGTKGLRVYTDKINAQIAAMTPQERASPAYVAGLDLVPSDAPDAHAVVRMNPAFYRARTSPLEPRLVLVSLPHNYRALDDLNRQLYREFDWAAIKALVNPPKR